MLVTAFKCLIVAILIIPMSDVAQAFEYLHVKAKNGTFEKEKKKGGMTF